MSYEHPHLETTNDIPFDSLDAVLDRREAHLRAWNGPKDHEPERWLTLLVAAAGEWAKAVAGGDETQVHDQAIEVAAIGLAIVQCSIRNGWAMEAIAS